MADERPKPLFASGNEAEWARMNQEEAQQDVEFVATAAGLALRPRS